MAKADETSTRLTRLWSNRYKRVPGDTVAILFRFDKAELDDRGQTALLEFKLVPEPQEFQPISTSPSSSRRTRTSRSSSRATRTTSATCRTTSS